eukprot:g11034.t1
MARARGAFIPGRSRLSLIAAASLLRACLVPFPFFSCISASVATPDQGGDSSVKSEDWVYNFQEIRAVCKEAAECPDNEMERLFEQVRSRRAAAERDGGRASPAQVYGAYFDDEIGDASVALDAIRRELKDIFGKDEEDGHGGLLYGEGARSASGRDAEFRRKRRRLLAKMFTPVDFQLVRFRGVNIRGVPTLLDVTETGTAETGPWALRFALQIPEPGYEHVESKEFRSVAEKPASASAKKRTTRVAAKGRPEISEFWSEKLMHYYAGMKFNVEVRFNRNYPLTAPRVSLHNNVEHAFLGGQGSEDRHAHYLPRVFFERSRGTVLAGGGSRSPLELHDRFDDPYRYEVHPHRYHLSRVLEKTLCFLTYIDAALLSLPFLTVERADELRNSVKQHASRTWFDKRQNLFVYPRFFVRNKDFFALPFVDRREAVLQRADDFWAEAATRRTGATSALLASTNTTGAPAATGRSAAAPAISNSDSDSVRVPPGGGAAQPLWSTPSAFPPQYLHPEFVAFQKELREIQSKWANATKAWPPPRPAGAVVVDRSALEQAEIRSLVNDRFLRNATEGCPNVYSFPLFTDEFCDKLVAEVRGVHDSQLKVQRPNSMNNYGVILNDIGLEPLMDSIQELLRPLGAARFGAVGANWDGHHAFIVQYAPRKDTHLDMHTDDSDVTVNVALGIGQFEGSEVRFCGKMGSPEHRKNQCVYKNRKGTAIMHLGRHRHGAMEITEGERMNLILWNRGSVYRETFDYDFAIHQKEAGPPDKVCLSYTHDRDYGRFKKYPIGQEHMKSRRKWCPKRGAEYDDFREERRGGA